MYFYFAKKGFEMKFIVIVLLLSTIFALINGFPKLFSLNTKRNISTKGLNSLHCQRGQVLINGRCKSRGVFS